MCRLGGCERVRVNCCDITGSLRLSDCSSQLNLCPRELLRCWSSNWSFKDEILSLPLMVYVLGWLTIICSKCSANIHRKDKDTELLWQEASQNSTFKLWTDQNELSLTFLGSWNCESEFSVSDFKVGLLQRRRWKHWAEETCLSSETRVRTCCQLWAA